jgi:hypothetical protein
MNHEKCQLIERVVEKRKKEQIKDGQIDNK